MTDPRARVQIPASPMVPARAAPPSHPVLVRAAAPFDLASAYREHHGFLWRLLRHLGVEGASIDDAVHDVFVVAWRRGRESNPRAQPIADMPVRPWLVGIARNVARDHRKLGWRRIRRRIALALTLRDCTSDGEIGRAEAARIVADLLASLPEDQRLALVLADLEGFSAPEIAAALGISVNTVSSRLRLARRRLEATVARGGEVEGGRDG